MKQIKTIIKRMDNEPLWNQFDIEVNNAIADGWTLTKREVLKPYEGATRTWCRMLYAELEREIIAEADRCCENCRHYDTPVTEEPCLSCNDAADKWEPAE